MKKVRRILCILIIAGLLPLGACGVLSSEIQESGFSQYYLNEELDQLVTEPYTPEETETDALIEDMIIQQSFVPEGKKLVRLLPEDVQIQGYLLDKNILTLDFNSNYRNMATGREMLVRGGLVREFLQIDGVERVQFTIEGAGLKDSHGNDIGVMTNESFVENSAETINAYQSVTMTLYFTDPSGTRLLPESRKVYYISSEPMERAVVEELLKGPRMPGHYSTFSTDSRILSVITQDNICYVNFDSSVVSSSQAVSEEAQIYSIVNSITDTCGVQAVQFSIDGDSNRMFRESMSLGSQYTKNESLVDRG